MWRLLNGRRLVPGLSRFLVRSGRPVGRQRSTAVQTGPGIVVVESSVLRSFTPGSSRLAKGEMASETTSSVERAQHESRSAARCGMNRCRPSLSFRGWADARLPIFEGRGHPAYSTCP